MFAPFVGVVGGTSIVQRKRAGTIRRRDLRPDDWQDIWPELAEPQTPLGAAQAQEIAHV